MWKYKLASPYRFSLSIGETIAEPRTTEITITQCCPTADWRGCKQSSHLYNNGTPRPFCKPLMPYEGAYTIQPMRGYHPGTGWVNECEIIRSARVIPCLEQPASEAFPTHRRFAAVYRRPPDAAPYGCCHLRPESHNRPGGKAGPKTWLPPRQPPAQEALPPPYPMRAARIPKIHQTGRTPPTPGRAQLNRHAAPHASAM